MLRFFIVMAKHFEGNNKLSLSLNKLENTNDIVILLYKVGGLFYFAYIFIIPQTIGYSILCILALKWV